MTLCSAACLASLCDMVLRIPLMGTSRDAPIQHILFLRTTDPIVNDPAARSNSRRRRSLGVGQIVTLLGSGWSTGVCENEYCSSLSAVSSMFEVLLCKLCFMSRFLFQLMLMTSSKSEFVSCRALLLLLNLLKCALLFVLRAWFQFQMLLSFGVLCCGATLSVHVLDKFRALCSLPATDLP